MKRVLAILLAAAMSLSLLAGCSKSSGTTTADTGSTSDTTSTSATTSSTAEIPAFTYGLSIWGNSDAHGYGVDKACSWLTQVGGTFVEDFGAYDADAQIASCEKLINAGCDFIVFCAYCGESIIPSVASLCQQNEVYFAIWDTTITDSSIQTMLDSNPYFCGTTNEDGYTGGYKEVQALAEQGATDFVFIKYAEGVATCDDRLEGAEAAIKELGLKESYVMTAPDDVKKAVQDVLTNYPDVNAVVSLGGSSTYMAPMAEAIAAVGKTGQIYTASFDYYDGMDTDLDSGVATVVAGGHICTGFYACIMCLSAMTGSPVNSERAQLAIPYIYCTSTDVLSDYNTYVVGDTPAYTADNIKTLLSCSFDQLQTYANNWTVENAKAGTLVK